VTQKADDVVSLQDSQVTTDSYKDDEKEGFLQSSMRSVKEEEENEQNKLLLKMKEKENQTEVAATGTTPNSAKSGMLTDASGGQLNLGTLGTSFQRNSSKFSKAMSATSTSTVPQKVRKKYLRDGRDLTRAPSPPRSPTQSPIR
jgi:hypothetical protein